eukprot:scaffold356_cov363-Prasinococcus_capsulatus_cf.AAC.5
MAYAKRASGSDLAMLQAAEAKGMVVVTQPFSRGLTNATEEEYDRASVLDQLICSRAQVFIATCEEKHAVGFLHGLAKASRPLTRVSNPAPIGPGRRIQRVHSSQKGPLWRAYQRSLGWGKRWRAVKCPSRQDRHGGLERHRSLQRNSVVDNLRQPIQSGIGLVRSEPVGFPLAVDALPRL